MARIDYLDENGATERTEDVLAKNGRKNIFKMLAHSESHLVNYCRLGQAIRSKGTLDPGLRELAITRTGILCESEYEVIAHKRISASVGVSPEKIAAIESGPDHEAFDEVERAVLRFADAVVTSHRPDDATFDAVAEHLSPDALVELQIAIGYYIMTSKFLRTFDIDLEPV